MSNEEMAVTASSGNVFEDLGFEDADEMALKSDLAYIISSIIESRGLTQGEAAQLLGLDHPEVLALVRGRLSGFPLNRLSGFLATLDWNAEVIGNEA